MGFTINQADTMNMYIVIFSTTVCDYNQSQTDVIDIDMDKAFDRISHKLLIIKSLKMIGFTEQFLL